MESPLEKSVRGAAAAGVVTLAGDERAIGTRQEMHHCRDLFGRASSSHGDALGHVVDLRLRELIENLGPDDRRRH